MKRHLVVGRGQVGSALIDVLSGYYNVESVDLGERVERRFGVIHICIPYGALFNFIVKEYLALYQAPDGLVIIHSSVALGTSARHAGGCAVHSPIRGVHPNLAEGIRTFTKFFGGPRADEAAAIFRNLGIRCITTPKAMDTEALKLWDTTYYGWNIVFEKAVKEYCDKHGLDFNIVYTLANKSYNKGYAALGMPNVQRPVLDHQAGAIGGHCVIPNAKILGGDIAETILAFDAEYMRKAA